MSFNYYPVQPSRPEEYSNPMGNLISNILGGYTAATNARYLQPKLQEELKKAKLYNQYYGRNKESQIGLRGAQAGHLGAMTQGLNISNPFLKHKLEQEEAQRAFGLQNPLLNQTGAAGQAGAYLYLQQHPELMGNAGQANQGQPNPMQNLNEGQSYIPPMNQQNGQANEQQSANPMQLMQEAILNSIKPKTTQGTPLEKAQNYVKSQEELYGKDSEQVKVAKDYVDKLAHGTKSADFWNSLPVNTKSHFVAIGQGAGFSPDETIRWLKSGKPLKDLLYEHGYKDETEVEPIYELTGSNQTQLQNRIFASKEADYLSKFIRNSTGEYARSVAGYSPKLIKDQLAGKNEEEQAKFMAARGLAPELVNLRLVLAGAKSTVAAQNQLRDKAMLDMKNFRTLVSPKVWNRMQEVMDSELQNMFKQARKGYGQKISTAITKSNEAENDPLGIR